MNIYDCIMYFDEDLILELRLNILNEYVDKFVIVEATRDHAGNKKSLNFDIKKFPQFENKITYLIVDDIPEKVDLTFLGYVSLLNIYVVGFGPKLPNIYIYKYKYKIYIKR